MTTTVVEASHDGTWYTKPNPRTLRDCSYAGARRVSGLRREPAEDSTLHRSTYPTEKQTPTTSEKFCADCELCEVISNPYRPLEGGSESVFQWDVWICVGSSAETAESWLHDCDRRPSLFCKLGSSRNIRDSQETVPRSAFPEI